MYVTMSYSNETSELFFSFLSLTCVVPFLVCIPIILRHGPVSPDVSLLYVLLVVLYPLVSVFALLCFQGLALFVSPPDRSDYVRLWWLGSGRASQRSLSSRAPQTRPEIVIVGRVPRSEIERTATPDGTKKRNLNNSRLDT